MRLTLQIEATGRQGDGVALHEGKRLFVPMALAGDKAAVELDGLGNLVSVAILPTGKGRTKPECQHFPQCGGCKMQHMELAAYIEWKHHFVARQLEENGLPTTVNPPILSPSRSRRRATLAAVRQGKNILLGFNQARSHQVIDLQMCSVLRPELVALLPPLRNMLGEYMADAKQLDIRLTLLDGVMDMVIIGGPMPELHEREILGIFAERANIGRISWRKSDKSPDEPIAHRLPVRAHFEYGTVEMPPGGFLQATKEGEEALSALVAAAVGNAASVADLFCGIGTFALAISPRPLTAVDGDGAAIKALQRAMQGRAKTSVVERNLAREPLTSSELNGFKAVIFDPPRDGAKTQAQEIAGSKVPKVVAVSCDLNSFCRDAKILQAGGYKLMEVSIVDQFLWSTHVELVGIFTR